MSYILDAISGVAPFILLNTLNIHPYPSPHHRRQQPQQQPQLQQHDSSLGRRGVTDRGGPLKVSVDDENGRTSRDSESREVTPFRQWRHGAKSKSELSMPVTPRERDMDSNKNRDKVKRSDRVIDHGHGHGPRHVPQEPRHPHPHDSSNLDPAASFHVAASDLLRFKHHSETRSTSGSGALPPPGHTITKKRNNSGIRRSGGNGNGNGNSNGIGDAVVVAPPALPLPPTTTTGAGTSAGASATTAGRNHHHLHSNFCHLCTRRAGQKLRIVGCKNTARFPRCKKSLCENCFKKYAAILGDFHSSLEDLNWSCTHCRGQCPDTAQCSTYRRINNDRYKMKMKERAKEQADTQARTWS